MLRPMSGSPVLSVVMPTYNRCDRVARALDALAAQDVDAPYEVIIVSDGSTDGTHEYLEALEYPVDLIVEIQQNQGPSAARNRGIARASGEYVVFLDDDIAAGPSLLSAHLDAQREVEGGLVLNGPMLTPADHEMDPWIEWEQVRLERQYVRYAAKEIDAHGRLFYSGNASMPRQMVLDAGGFDESFRRAEDMELGMRLEDAGAAFDFVGEAEGFHYAERSYDAWGRIAYDYGRHDIDFAETWTWLIPELASQWSRVPLPVRLITMLRLHVPFTAKLTQPVLDLLGKRRGRLGQFALSITYRIYLTEGIRDGLGSNAKLRELYSEGSVELEPSATSNRT